MIQRISDYRVIKRESPNQGKFVKWTMKLKRREIVFRQKGAEIETETERERGAYILTLCYTVSRLNIYT